MNAGGGFGQEKAEDAALLAQGKDDNAFLLESYPEAFAIFWLDGLLV